MTTTKTAAATIAVMGASGRTGSRIAETLLDRGVQVRALARSAQRLAPLAARGATVLAGQSTDVAYLTEALRGADAAYVLMPHDPTEPGYFAAQRRQGEAIAQAVRASGLRRVVFLSSLGADQPEGTGVVQALHEQEQRLRAIPGIDVLFLRPGAFYETYEAMLPVIDSAGILADAAIPNLPVPMVATTDIAEAAVQALLATDWRGTVVREVLGPRDLTSEEVARILGENFARPGLPYVQLPYAEMAQALTEAGFAPDTAALTVELMRGINEGRVRALQPRDPASARRLPFERFAEALARRAGTDAARG